MTRMISGFCVEMCIRAQESDGLTVRPAISSLVCPRLSIGRRVLTSTVDGADQACERWGAVMQR